MHKSSLIILLMPMLVGCSHGVHHEDSWPWESLFSKAESARLSKDYTQAAILYRQAIPLAAETSQPEMNLAISLGRLGLVDSSAGSPSAKQKELDDSIKIFEKLCANRSKDNDLVKKEFIRSLTARGELARTMNDYAAAQTSYDRALGLMSTISQRSATGDLLLADERLLCHAGLGDIEAAAGKVDQSIKSYQLALNEEVISEDLEHILRTKYDCQVRKLGKLTPEISTQGTFVPDKATADKATKQPATQSASALPLVRKLSLNNLVQDRWKENIEAGLSAGRRHDYAVSEKRFQKALALVQGDAPCDSLVLRTYEYLIACTRSAREFSKSEEYFLSVRPCLSNRTGEDLKVVERIYGAIAALYDSERKYKDEEQILRQQLKIRSQIRDIAGAYGAEVECKIGAALLALKNYRKAEECLLSAINKSQPAGGNAALARNALLLLMQCYLGEKRNSQAIELRKQHPEIFN